VNPVEVDAVVPSICYSFFALVDQASIGGFMFLKRRSVHGWKVSVLLSVLLSGVLALVVSGAAYANPRIPAANPNPIDWTVITTIIGKDGEDLPYRVGQHDFGLDPGFGQLHIEDGHGGFRPDPGLMQKAAEACKSDPNPAAKTTCSIKDSDGRLFIVLWTQRIDESAPDGRPVGIITAYYA
jgi:hypothetical protein